MRSFDSHNDCSTISSLFFLKGLQDLNRNIQGNQVDQPLQLQESIFHPDNRDRLHHLNDLYSQDRNNHNLSNHSVQYQLDLKFLADRILKLRENICHQDKRGLLHHLNDHNSLLDLKFLAGQILKLHVNISKLIGDSKN